MYIQDQTGENVGYWESNPNTLWHVHKLVSEPMDLGTGTKQQTKPVVLYVGGYLMNAEEINELKERLRRMNENIDANEWEIETKMENNRRKKRSLEIWTQYRTPWFERR